MVVLWSRASAQSDWVCEEAQDGADRECLVPILIDSTEPPLGFRRFQALRFGPFRSASDGILRELVDAILALPQSGQRSIILDGGSPPFKVSADASPQRVVLIAVANSTRTSLDALTRGVSLSKSTIMEALKALELNGYVERHEVRDKGTRFSATARGRSLLVSE